jgi:hypothetical protein
MVMEPGFLNLLRFKYLADGRFLACTGKVLERWLQGLTAEWPGNVGKIKATLLSEHRGKALPGIFLCKMAATTDSTPPRPYVKRRTR